MAIVQPEKLLVDYSLYQTWNGFVIPQINDEDIANGLTTPELKYEAWARYTQNILNVILQEELDNIGYDLELVKPGFQRSLIKIMITRLMRAFHNDELIPRDSQVQVSQQGGIQYSSTGSIDSKSALYSFFDGRERAMIETSGLLEDTFSIDITQTQSEFDNQFKSGEFVPDVDLSEFQKINIVLNGQNTTVLQAITDLNSGKVNTANLVQAIATATGLSTTTALDKITVAQNKYLEYISFRQNKGDNEIAQFKDIKDSEARSRTDIVLNQKEIAKQKNINNTQDERLDFLEAIELPQEIIDLPDQPYNLTGSETIATFDLKSITIEDPANPGNQIPKFGDFSDSLLWTIELFDSAIGPDGSHQAHTFRRNKSGTYIFGAGASSDAFTATISPVGLLSVTRTNGNKNTTTLKITEIGVNQLSISLDTQQIISLINQRVKSQLIQGANSDFETFADFKGLISDDEFVAISFASGTKVTGRIIDTGGTTPIAPVIIAGYQTVNNTVKFGKIYILNNFDISGGFDLTIFSQDIYEATQQIEQLKLDKLEVPRQSDGAYLITKSGSSFIYKKVIFQDINYTFDDGSTILIKHVKE